MKTYESLSGKQRDIADTILMRTAREWVSTRQLARELGYGNANQLTGIFNLLKAEGYVFKKKRREIRIPHTSETLYRQVEK